MDENEVIDQNPLAQMEQSTAPRPSAAPTSGNLPQEPVLSPVEKAQKIYEQEKLNLIRRQQELVAELEGRVKTQPGDYLSAIAQGFGNPQNLSFASGVAGAAGNIGSLQANEQKRIQDLAKMKLELGMQELGLRKEDVGTAFLKSKLGGSSAQSVSGQTPVQGAAQSGDASGLRNITPQDILIIGRTNPDLAKSLSDAIKMEQDRFVIAQNGTVFDRRTGDYIRIPVPGQTQSDFATPFGTYKMTPSQYAEFEAAQNKGQGREWIQKFRYGTSGSVPSTAAAGAPVAGETTAQAPGRKTVAESEAEAIRLKQESEEVGKYSGGKFTSVMTAADSAPMFRDLAQQNIEIINNNPDAVGILAQPGVRNALLGLLKDVRARSSQSGEVSIDTSAIEKAILTAGPKRMAGESDKAYQNRVQGNIDAANYLARNLSQMELYAARSLLKGQGAVANMERLIVRALGGSISDPKQALIAKNEMISITSKYDELVRDAMLDWQDKNPNRNVANFFARSDEYKKLLKDYNSEISGLTKKYFAGSMPKSSDQGSNELRDRLKQQLGF